MKRLTIYGMMMLCALSFTFISCGDDKDDDAPTHFSVTPDNVTLYAGQEKQLSATGAIQWSSDNEFVASVDEQGKVTAHHIGTANIFASDGNAMGQCAVTVQPQYNCWATPLMTWRASMSEIAAAETHQLETAKEDKYLVYSYTEGSTQAYVQYVFDNRGLEGINVLVNGTTEFGNIAYFLNERYLYYTQTEAGIYYFIDSNSLETATLAVALGTISEDGNYFTIATYIPQNLPSRPIDAPKRVMSLNKNITAEMLAKLTKEGKR